MSADGVLSTADNWPFYERLARLNRDAGKDPPVRSVISLFEISDEVGGIELIELIASEAATAEAAVTCFMAVLEALDQYRSRRHSDSRPAVASLHKLKKARDKDLKQILQRYLDNPGTAQGLLSLLFNGLKAAGPLDGNDDVQSAEGPLNQHFSEDGQWALDLAGNAASFRDVAQAAIERTPGTADRVSLVRRLRELKCNPTQRRLLGLLRDAREHGSTCFSGLAAALRFGARHTIFRNTALPGRWFAAVANDPTNIEMVAGSAHAFLLGLLPGQGRPRDLDLEHYCDVIAQIYGDMTGGNISYSKPTTTSKIIANGKAYGKGLRYMQLSLRLIDKSATASQAQNQIDRIRGFKSG